MSSSIYGLVCDCGRLDHKYAGEIFLFQDATVGEFVALVSESILEQSWLVLN